MGLRQVFAEALPDIFAAAGEDATFTPASGDPIACKVFIDFSVMLQPSGAEAQIWQQGTTIEALLSVLGREPNRGETFTLDIPEDDTIYTIQAILANDGLTVKAVVT